MIFIHRLRLLAFGLFTWSVAMFTAADAHTPELVQAAAPLQGGLGGVLFAVALLPGRTARFE